MQEKPGQIDRQLQDEAPPAFAVRLRFVTTTASPKTVLERTREVMRVVEGVGAAWPTDDEWRQLLPAWFLSRFDGHTLDEVMADPNLWDFGSWLDAMKHRGWECWSENTTEQDGVVICVPISDPYSIEPLVYLLRSAGASHVEFEKAKCYTPPS